MVLHNFLRILNDLRKVCLNVLKLSLGSLNFKLKFSRGVLENLLLILANCNIIQGSSQCELCQL